ncbi:MAG: hypothetical protein ACLP0J_03845 [Solirubrobacteraceae bacterium]
MAARDGSISNSTVREPERALIWIEAKLRSPESGKSQLSNYKAALGKFDPSMALAD